ncbi:threonine aldolase family protein [Nonomuraea rubra]|uniref:threonine aldolase family protein n=1 Tax=Nonomuraea rubra TaxID=46180 RepID=UPI00361DA6A4
MADGDPPVRRALFLHAPIRRRPRAVLERMLELVDDDTPPDGPDGPVAVLERRLAGLLGKERALFFPSGTMAQQAVLRVYADRGGRRTFAGHPFTHLDVWEEQGYNAVHGLRFRRTGDPYELMTAQDLCAIGEPLAAVVWELPQRDLGGLLPEWDELGEQVGLMRATGAAAHLDGARLWEAQTYYRRPLDEIAGLFDSVYVSLYKSLQGVRGPCSPATRVRWPRPGCGGSGSAAASRTRGRSPWPPSPASAPSGSACPSTASTRSPSRPPSTPTALPAPGRIRRRRRCSTCTCPLPGGPWSRPAGRCWRSRACSSGAGCAAVPTRPAAASRSRSARTRWTSRPRRWPPSSATC